MTAPRGCQFCQSRHLVCQEVPVREAQPAGYFAVECLFCHGRGPSALSREQAWLAWSGQLLRAPASFGAPNELVGG
jgi:hypothetical protein